MVGRKIGFYKNWAAPVIKKQQQVKGIMMWAGIYSEVGEAKLTYSVIVKFYTKLNVL